MSIVHSEFRGSESNTQMYSQYPYFECNLITSRDAPVVPMSIAQMIKAVLDDDVAYDGSDISVPTTSGISQSRSCSFNDFDWMEHLDASSLPTSFVSVPCPDESKEPVMTSAILNELRNLSGIAVRQWMSRANLSR